MKVLITGGAGYIGSHTAVELIAAGHDICVVDNYSNSSPAAIDRIRMLTDRPFNAYDCDVRDRERLMAVRRDMKDLRAALSACAGFSSGAGGAESSTTRPSSSRMMRVA